MDANENKNKNISECINDVKNILTTLRCNKCSIVFLLLTDVFIIHDNRLITINKTNNIQISATLNITN